MESLTQRLAAAYTEFTEEYLAEHPESLLDPFLQNAIEQVPLRADPPFQTMDTTLQELSDKTADTLRAAFAHFKEFPTLHLLISPARSGSTALANVFGSAGIPSFYQPIKTVFRHHMLKLTPPTLEIPESSVLFFKETIGPYTTAESLLNPLEILTKAGFPKENIRLIILARNTENCLKSWLCKFTFNAPKSILTKNFALTIHNLQRLTRFANHHQFNLSHYVQTASLSPEQAIQNLFKKLDLEDYYHPRIINCWDDITSLDDPESQVIFYPEPDAFGVPALHETQPKYGFFSTSKNKLSLTPSHLQFIQQNQLDMLYTNCQKAYLEEHSVNKKISSNVFPLPNTNPELLREPALYTS